MLTRRRPLFCGDTKRCLGAPLRDTFNVSTTHPLILNVRDSDYRTLSQPVPPRRHAGCCTETTRTPKAAHVYRGNAHATPSVLGAAADSISVTWSFRNDIGPYLPDWDPKR